MEGGGGGHVIELGCFVDMHDELWQSFPPFGPLVIPPHRVLVSSGERKIFLVVDLPLLVLGEVRVEGELLFFFCAGEGGVWELKAKYHIPILSASSAIIERREGMLAWRCWILGLPGLSSRIVQMEVRIFPCEFFPLPFQLSTCTLPR